MGRIIIKGKEFTFEQIRNGQWPAQEPYFQTSLSFCHDWLNGKHLFELQTSGSTGTPKQIMVTRAQMSSSAKATRDFFNIPVQANLLCCLNTAMIAGKMMLVRAMEWDSILYIVEPQSNPLLSIDPVQQFVFATMVPLQLETCLHDAHTAQMLTHIVHLLIGGAPIADSLRHKAALLPGNLYQTYGMTETVSHIALANLKADGALIYELLPGVACRQDEEEKLAVKAPMTNDRWIWTNDIVEMLSDRSFIWKGRADFTINTGGVKVQPEEVEAAAVDIMAVHFPGQRYFVTALPDERLGQKVILLVEAEPVAEPKVKEVLHQLKTKLSAYHAPKDLLFVPNFAETASHKVNRDASLARWMASQAENARDPNR